MQKKLTEENANNQLSNMWEKSPTYSIIREIKIILALTLETGPSDPTKFGKIQKL